MTRNRINIDLDPALDGWLTTTATVVGCSKTEAARALLTYTQANQPPSETLRRIAAEHHLEANLARSRSQTARHQARRESAPQHQPD